MSTGTLYSIGIGPGDPELLTVKATKILSRTRQVFVPKARTARESIALAIAGTYIPEGAGIHDLIFPMTSSRSELTEKWKENAAAIAAVLETGEDASFITLGDPCLYSTGIYLIRELRKLLPEVRIVIVPGITSFSAASALTGFPVGERKQPITIIPVDHNLDQIRCALQQPGTVVLMKIGERLNAVLDILDECSRMEDSVFISRAGLDNERIVTDLRVLKNAPPETGYLSIILVRA
jgi:precorrin-2/cobalt-factor-2 C20-methyltransferase